MRLLCDQNVAGKYVQAFENHDEFVVSTVAEELSPDTSDDDIVAYAARYDWVVFTSDDDFFEPGNHRSGSRELGLTVSHIGAYRAKPVLNPRSQVE